MNIKPVILAAGKGSRMNSDLPKVLHEIHGKPMINYLLKTLDDAGFEKPILIIGKGATLVKKTLGDNFEYALQRKRLGSGHAVKIATPNMAGFDTILVVCGDMPLLSKKTLEKVAKVHLENASTITFTSLILENIKYYKFGRVVRDQNGSIIKIAEEVDATPEEMEIKEGNTGVYFFNGPWLIKNLPKMRKNHKGEYCLTDLVELAANDHKKVLSVEMESQIESHGINTQEQLREAEQYLKV